jgi:hypothetical protein
MHRAEVVRRLRIDDRTWVMAISLLSLCIGVGMVSPVAWGVLAPRPAFSLAAFSWLALTRLSQQNPDTETDFPRTLLPALAVLQVLHAYPVAGSQLGWSTVLLMVVGAMCIANGARGLLASIRVASPRGPSTLLGSVGAAALILFLGTDYLYRPWEQARSTYKELTPLMLHGASRIVVRPLRAERFREISAALKTRCTAVVMLPGMNSFYLWSNVEPPTGFNATAWMFMFSDELQQRIVDRVEHIDGLCLLRNRPQEALWARPRAFREGPLLRFMSRGFEQIDRFGPFELSRRNAPKS